MSAPNQNSPLTGFLSLPPEVRNEIYRMALGNEPLFPTNELARRVQGTRVALYPRPVMVFYPPLALMQYAPLQQPLNPTWMQVNRLLRREVGSIFFGTRAMFLTATTRDVPILAAFLERTVRDIGRADPFASLTIDIRDTTWQTLQDIAPLVEAVRSGLGENFTLLSRGARPRGNGRNLANSLRRGIDIGVRARQQGWGRVRTRREVGRWAETERQTDVGLAAAAAARNQRRMRPRTPWYEGKKRRG